MGKGRLPFRKAFAANPQIRVWDLCLGSLQPFVAHVSVPSFNSAASSLAPLSFAPLETTCQHKQTYVVNPSAASGHLWPKSENPLTLWHQAKEGRLPPAWVQVQLQEAQHLGLRALLLLGQNLAQHAEELHHLRRKKKKKKR